jgi:hypothetical protein
VTTPTSRPCGAQVTFNGPDEPNPTTPNRSRFDPSGQGSAKASYAAASAAASVAIRALDSAQSGALDSPGPISFKEFRAAFASTTSVVTSAGGMGGPESRSPSRPTSAGGMLRPDNGLETPGGTSRAPTAAPSRPESPTGRDKASSDPAKDTMKQLYEMQKVMVEVARRHNKLGDLVTKMEKTVKNRLDIQEKVFVKLAKQVDELNHFRDQMPGGGAGSGGH